MLLALISLTPMECISTHSSITVPVYLISELEVLSVLLDDLCDFKVESIEEGVCWLSRWFRCSELL